MKFSFLKTIAIASIVLGASSAANAECDMAVHIAYGCHGMLKILAGGGGELYEKAQTRLANDVQAGTCTADQMRTAMEASKDAASMGMHKVLTKQISAAEVTGPYCVNAGLKYSH